MTASAYCTRSDVDDVLSGGSLPNPGRLIADVATSTDIMSLDGHGLNDGTELVFRAESGGSLPAPLVAGTTYYALRASDSTFRVAATSGGSPIDFTTAGSLVVVTRPLPYQAAIQWGAALIDEHLAGNQVQLTAPYPQTVIAANAELAAWKLLAFTGQASVRLADVITNTMKLLDMWVKGKPVRGPIVPPSANLAVTSIGSSGPPGGTIP